MEIQREGAGESISSAALDLQVRLASQPDAPGVRRLTLAFSPKMPILPVAAFEERYSRLLSDESWCLAVASSGDLLLGYALAQDFRPGLRTAFTTGRLHDLYVDGQARGAGAGGALASLFLRGRRAVRNR